LLREPLWSICVDRVRDFVFQYNLRPLAGYSAAIVVVIVCAAAISITIYHQPEHVQFAVESSPVPSTRPANAEREFNLAPPAMPRTFNTGSILLATSRDVPVLPSDALGSDQFVPLARLPRTFGPKLTSNEY
jgi:hypothetical protein